MNKLGGILLFVLGTGIGSGVTCYVLSEKHKTDISELEETIKAAYDAKYVKKDTKPEEEKTEEPVLDDIARTYKAMEKKKNETLTLKKEMVDYNKIVKEEKYTSDEEETVKEKEMGLIDGEIIIEPDNYDEREVVGFGMPPFDNVVFATYYADGYLVDSEDHIISIERIGGEEALEHFGEGDDPELLHVRNVLYELDFEIDRDSRTYAEVSGKDPADLPDPDDIPD